LQFATSQASVRKGRPRKNGGKNHLRRAFLNKGHSGWSRHYQCKSEKASRCVVGVDAAHFPGGPRFCACDLRSSGHALSWRHPGQSDPKKRTSQFSERDTGTIPEKAHEMDSILLLKRRAGVKALQIRPGAFLFSCCYRRVAGEVGKNSLCSLPGALGRNAEIVLDMRIKPRVIRGLVSRRIVHGVLPLLAGRSPVARLACPQVPTVGSCVSVVQSAKYRSELLDHYFTREGRPGAGSSAEAPPLRVRENLNGECVSAEIF
jgi:hypothetical protein